MNATFDTIDHPDPLRIQGVLAANLRRLRIARRLSLSELARATAVGKATLSSIENGRANPTVETLAALADALKIPISELLEQPPLGDVTVVRAARSAPPPREGLSRRLLDQLVPAGRLELSEITLDPRQIHEPPPRPAGSRAHLYVLQGKLISGPVERITELAAGDYMTFPADVPHQYEAGRAPARALLLSESPD